MAVSGRKQPQGLVRRNRSDRQEFAKTRKRTQAAANRSPGFPASQPSPIPRSAAPETSTFTIVSLQQAPFSTENRILSAQSTVLRTFQTDADRAAIRSAELDYIEGWYTADAARMERAVHPELAKRVMRREDSSGLSSLAHMTSSTTCT